MSANNEDTSLTNPDVVTKFRTAGEVASAVLKKIVSLCVVEANISELCKLGDSEIVSRLSNKYSKPKILKGEFANSKHVILKGVAFPTSISVNNCACHFSPIEGEPESSLVLHHGDLVKIELGAHIDGYPAIVGTSLVVGSSIENPVNDIKADLIQAAYLAGEAAIRMLTQGYNNIQVAETVNDIARNFGVVPVEGSLSYQVTRDNLDGEKQILLNPNESQKKTQSKVEFKKHEAYVIDMVVSSGEGKIRPSSPKTTIFKKNDITYLLKLKASRTFLSEVNNRFGNMAFHIRSMEDEKKARLGLLECLNHSLISPYEVLYEKENALVARFVFTVLLLPNGPLKITSDGFNPEIIRSAKSLSDEKIKALLETPIRPKKEKETPV